MLIPPATYAALVGKLLVDSSAANSQTVMVSGDAVAKSVFPPGTRFVKERQPVTKDYFADRVTVTTDAASKIVDISFG